MGFCRKNFICGAVLVAGFILTLSFTGRGDTGRTQTADNASAYLIRFGLDGAADVD